MSKSDEIEWAMGLLLTAHQRALIHQKTLLGRSRKELVRRLINLGIEREFGGKWVRVGGLEDE